MVYNISVGNFVLLDQGMNSKEKIETVYDFINVSSIARSNLIPENIIHHVPLSQLTKIHKDIIRVSLTHDLEIRQYTHPKSRYYNLIQTIPLESDVLSLPYAPLISDLNLAQVLSYYTATPIYQMVVLTQLVTTRVIRLLNITNTITLHQGTVGFISEKRWLPNRGDYIPPNAQFVFDVNLQSFVKKPNVLVFNGATGYYEGTNTDSLFVQSNGFALWP